MIPRLQTGAPSFDVFRQTLALPQLSPALEGLTIAQISDLHIERWNLETVEAAAVEVSRLQPDLLVCTGDTIATGPTFLPEVARLLGRFEARYAKIACLGNHDYADGEKGAGVRRALHQAGFQVLVNESLSLTVGHGHLNLAGIDDWEQGRPCLTSTFQHCDAGRPTVLLCHNPSRFHHVAQHRIGHSPGPEVMLSGHTHGGQIALPLAWRRRLLGSPFVAGHYQVDHQHLYVNRGMGVAVMVHHTANRRWAIPTPRLFVRAEITLLTLRRSPEGELGPQTFHQTREGDGLPNVV